MLTKRHLLFLIIVIEGYVVLAIELLAIRTMIPFVGSGTEVIAIIISAVLLPLAIGYNHGGIRFKKQYSIPHKRSFSIRQILLKNILISLIILSFGLSYAVQECFFLCLVKLGLYNYIIQTFLFCAVFLVFPIYLLGQTIPLLSNFFTERHLSKITGKMLFFSTIGSFGGSVFSSLVLMPIIGVHFTLVVTLFLLAMAIMMLTKSRYTLINSVALLCLGVAITLNSQPILKSMSIVSNNQYSTIKVGEQRFKMGRDEEEDWKVFKVNNSFINNALSSAYSKSGNKIPVHEFIEKNLISSSDKVHAPLSILVIGAAGFALGMQDTYNHYVFVDIDPAMKPIAEKYFLPEPLQKNKLFYAMSARAFLRQSTQRYDLIVLDLFSNPLSFPQEVISQDFLMEVKNHLNQGGIVASNILSSLDYENLFSIRYDNTFASVFPHSSRQIIGSFNAWSNAKIATTTLFIYFDRPNINDNEIYTDDRNRYSLDK